MSITVTVVDYGIGNVQSIINALSTFNVTVKLSADSSVINDSDAVILPGVGAFKKAMEELKVRDLDNILRRFESSGRPMLGICLGMQLLFDESEEFGLSEGLGLIKGRVVRFPAEVKGKLPHISWNNLNYSKPAAWKNTILHGVKPAHDFYFVHSYICCPAENSHVLATTEYGGINFCSVTKRNNVYGCQFHPEKSSVNGLDILNAFLQLAKAGT